MSTCCRVPLWATVIYAPSLHLTYMEIIATHSEYSLFDVALYTYMYIYTRIYPDLPEYFKSYRSTNRCEKSRDFDASRIKILLLVNHRADVFRCVAHSGIVLSHRYSHIIYLLNKI